MSVCQFIVAITGTVASFENLAAQKAAIAFVCIYIFFFASSWGPVAWVVTGELFPLKVRAKGLSMTTASNWLLNFAIAYSTPYMVDAEYADLQSKVFFVWGSFCFVCIAFVWFMIYETKGLSLEEVRIVFTFHFDWSWLLILLFRWTSFTVWLTKLGRAAPLGLLFVLLMLARTRRVVLLRWHRLVLDKRRDGLVLSFLVGQKAWDCGMCDG